MSIPTRKSILVTDDESFRAALRQLMREQGLLEEKDIVEFEDPPGPFRPIHVRGVPLSQTILDERGPR